MFSSTLRMKVESSTTSTRIFFEGIAIFLLRHRRDRAWRLRSDKLFEGRDQLIFLDRLGEKSGSAFLHCALAMLGPGARSHHHHRNAARGRALAQLHHQFVAGHARHLEVRDDQVTAVLRNEFRGFEAVGGELYAVAILFQHASDEFAHADGVVGHDDNALLLDAVDGFRGNGAAGHGRRARRKNTRGAGVGLERPEFGWFRRHHAVQVDQQNQAAVWRNRRAREQFHAAEIFAEILDHNFVFAENFLDHQADLMISGVSHDHAEESVDRLERRQAQIGVYTDDFGDDVADFGQQFAANVLNFVRAQAADFLDDGERHGEICRAAAHKQRRRNNKSQGNFEREFCALAGDALDLDFSVQGIQVGPHDVKTYAAARELRFDRSSGESGMEEHFAQVALGEPVSGFHRNEAALNGAFLDAVVFDAPAIIFDFDVDVIAAVIRAQHDLPGFRFVGNNAIAARLYAVRHGVTHEVDERIRNLLNNVVVEFSFTSGQFEFHL